MPPPQARERRRVLAGGAEGSGESGDARGLSAAGEGRDGAAGEAGAVAGTRISECRSQPARRPGRDVYGKNRLGLSPSLARCLGSTNLIESPHSGVRLRTRRVCRWRDGKMVLRWAAAAFLITESNFRRIMGYRDLWMLEAALGRKTPSLEERAA